MCVYVCVCVCVCVCVEGHKKMTPKRDRSGKTVDTIQVGPQLTAHLCSLQKTFMLYPRPMPGTGYKVSKNSHSSWWGRLTFIK